MEAPSPTLLLTLFVELLLANLSPPLKVPVGDKELFCCLESCTSRLVTMAAVGTFLLLVVIVA